jgi:hypothetical protein
MNRSFGRRVIFVSLSPANVVTVDRIEEHAFLDVLQQQLEGIRDVDAIERERSLSMSERSASCASPARSKNFLPDSLPRRSRSNACAARSRTTPHPATPSMSRFTDRDRRSLRSSRTGRLSERICARGQWPPGGPRDLLRGAPDRPHRAAQHRDRAPPVAHGRRTVAPHQCAFSSHPPETPGRSWSHRKLSAGS